ncbi:MAG: enoyl-CoA hydratase/isomerase family protein [Pseudomonadota bacterium]
MSNEKSLSLDDFQPYKDLSWSLRDGVATVEMCRPPHNYFDGPLIDGLVEALNHLDRVDACRVVVLAAQGKSFCAGADFSNSAMSAPGSAKQLYQRALGLFRTRKPIVAAVQGAAVGAGLGLALTADFRVVAAGSKLSANFCRLGFHPGFGLSFTLPRLVGVQQSSMLFYTGRRMGGEEAVAIGLADILADEGQVLNRAQALALEIAESAPLAVMSTRATLRASLADEVGAAMVREASEQDWQWRTLDFKEGVAAMAERRLPDFTGR